MKRNSELLAETLVCAGIFLLVVGAVACLAWLQASCEAAAYRRVTGKHVSTWDAVFLDLRVSEEAKE